MSVLSNPRPGMELATIDTTECEHSFRSADFAFSNRSTHDRFRKLNCGRALWYPIFTVQEVSATRKKFVSRR